MENCLEDGLNNTFRRMSAANWTNRPFLNSLVVKRTHSEVIDGPFKGMKILEDCKWGDGDISSKLLGIYENELYSSVEDAISRQPDKIINVGCAEGFYGVGLARRLPSLPVVFIDIDRDSIEIARRNVRLNGVAEDRCQFLTESSQSSIKSLAAACVRPFIVMDCEGAEATLMESPSGYENSIILVETHDFAVPNIRKTLMERFSASHRITEIKQGAKNPYLPVIDDFPDISKMLIACENRPQTMYWLYMIPKHMASKYY